MNHLENSSILVTGGTGFIGQHLVNRLLRMNCEVTILDINIPKNKFNNNSGKIRFIREDICNKIDVQKFGDLNLDIIFHLASSANVPKSVEDPEYDFFSTAFGSFNMLQLARRKKIKKFIYISTVSVFDRNNDMPIHEKSFIKVSSPFGASKLTGESYCYAFNRTYGLNINVVRLFNAYGPGMRKYFIYDMICKFIDNPANVEMLGDGNQIRDYLYIDDVIDGFLLIAEKGKPGEDYNLGSGKPVKIMDVALKIADIMNIVDFKINLTKESWPGDIKQWYAYISKVKRLGFSVKTGLTNGLKKTINEILETRQIKV
ncbi:MAG: NAD-dependent epimerase/dehydratase family protein [Candidatus Cloacimonetes bacterium]|nr:NAD-dependent epimerase/dehydratase family protein [Candidatus Cloacimonadota bacterium]